MGIVVNNSCSISCYIIQECTAVCYSSPLSRRRSEKPTNLTAAVSAERQQRVTAVLIMVRKLFLSRI